MMSIVVRVVCAADGSKTPHDGCYVVAWNPHTKAGILELTSTPNPAEAYHFANVGQVVQEYRTVSRIERVRSWDGRLNRPLTGVTVEFCPAP